MCGHFFKKKCQVSSFFYQSILFRSQEATQQTEGGNTLEYSPQISR